MATTTTTTPSAPPMISTPTTEGICPLTNHLTTPSLLNTFLTTSPLPADLTQCIIFATCALTHTAGLLLELPPSVTATACVALQRYFLLSGGEGDGGIMETEFSDLSAGVLYTTAKVSSTPVTVGSVGNVYAYLSSSTSSFFRLKGARGEKLDAKEREREWYMDEADVLGFTERILEVEGMVLGKLGFDLAWKSPVPLAVAYLGALSFFALPSTDGKAPTTADGTTTTTPDGAGTEEKKPPTKERLAALTLKHLNSTLLSPQFLCLTHSAPALAMAAIYTASRELGVKMPGCEWWEVFDVEREELGFLVVAMRSLTGWVEGEMQRGGGAEGKDGGIEGGAVGIRGFGRRGVVRRQDVVECLRRRGVRVDTAGG